jgi:hypothetical protein
VAPEHQRKGVGSMLLRWGCDKADCYGWNSFVMASPNAVPLYSKFGFKAVGQVCTGHGTFKSMFRESTMSTAEVSPVVRSSQTPVGSRSYIALRS